MVKTSLRNLLGLLPRPLEEFPVYSKYLFTIISVAIFLGIAQGQTTGPTDNRTPLALAPGAPEGSRIEEFANVNLFNGNLNFAMELGVVGGRGSMGIPIMLTIERHWQVQMRCDTSITGQLICNKFVSSMWWGNQPVGYGPGTILGRLSGFSLKVAALQVISLRSFSFLH